MVKWQGALHAVLQVRGEFNTEKLQGESFGGVCQVSAHGKVDDQETWGDGLAREVEEELGAIMGTNIRSAIALQKLEQLEQLVIPDKKTVTTYGILLPIEALRDIRLGPSSGGLRLVSEEQLLGIRLVDPASEHDRQLGSINRCEIAMFPDEHKSLCKAFVIFNTTD